jgi:hypothetical protein
MTNKLREVATLLAKARAVKAQAEKDIKELTPIYFRLLDEAVGQGAVTFDHDGYRFGRVIAEKPTFDLDRFVTEHPEIADKCVTEKIQYVLDEDALNDYLAVVPEAQDTVSQYVTTKEEARWKPPVKVKE